MDLLSRIRGGQKAPDQDTIIQETTITNTAVATRRQVSAQEAENRRDKGIDIDMIDPEEIVQELQQLAHFNYYIKVDKLVTIENNGHGLISQVVRVDEPRLGTRPWAIAALGYLNKVWPTIWMTTFEADTTKLRIRTAFHDIRKSMNPDEKQAYGVVLKMVMDLCLARCEDMKEGHKPLLLKVHREELKVGMSRENPVKK